MAIGEAIEGELRLQAEKRMKAGVHNPKENFPEGQEGQTRDLAAKAAGFGNGKTYEQARRLTYSPRHHRYTQRLYLPINWALRA